MDMTCRICKNPGGLSVRSGSYGWDSWQNLAVPTATLVQLLLVAWLVREENGGWTWSGIKRRLRLNLPLSPETGSPSPGRLGWILPWALVRFVLTAIGMIASGFGLLIRPVISFSRTLGVPLTVRRAAVGMLAPRPEYAAPFVLPTRPSPPNASGPPRFRRAA